MTVDNVSVSVFAACATTSFTGAMVISSVGSAVGSPCVGTGSAVGSPCSGVGSAIGSPCPGVGSADCSVSVSSGVVSTSIAPHPPAIADAGSRPATIISASSTENSFLNT